MSLEYEITGSGPAIVLVHGFCESKEVWRAIVPLLAENHTVIDLNLPGIGRSPALQEGFDLRQCAATIKATLLEVGLKNCSVVGHSMGGYIGLELLKSDPNFLRSLTLFHSSVFSDTQAKIHTRQKTIKFIEKHGLQSFTQSFVPNLFFDSENASIDKVMQMGNGIAADVVVGYANAMIARDSSEKVVKLTSVPLHFIVGSEDPIIELDAAIQQSILPDFSCISILSNCGHMGMLEQPGQCVLKMLEFEVNLG